MRRLSHRTAAARVALVPRVVVTLVDDGYTLLDRHGRVLHLNTTAALMLDALLTDGLESAVTATCQRFGIAEERARADVDELLTQLRNKKLVRCR